MDESTRAVLFLAGLALGAMAYASFHPEALERMHGYSLDEPDFETPAYYSLRRRDYEREEPEDLIRREPANRAGGDL
jgi:hypothetical protein